MSLKKIFLLPTSQTQSKYGKEENGKRLFTTREEKEECGKTDGVDKVLIQFAQHFATVARDGET